MSTCCLIIHSTKQNNSTQRGPKWQNAIHVHLLQNHAQADLTHLLVLIKKSVKALVAIPKSKRLRARSA